MRYLYFHFHLQLTLWSLHIRQMYAPVFQVFPEGLRYKSVQPLFLHNHRYFSRLYPQQRCFHQHFLHCRLSQNPYMTYRNQTDTSLYRRQQSENIYNLHKYLPHNNSCQHLQNMMLTDNLLYYKQWYQSAFRSD